MRGLAFVLVAVLCACTGPGAERTAPVASSVSPQRIVTLNGTLTEIVATLGLGDRIVGVDVTSTFPEEVKALPKVGHDRSIRAEGVLSLRPDAVMAREGQLDPGTAAQLREAGVRLMLFPQELSVEGSKVLISRVAESLGVASKAVLLNAAIDDQLTEAAALVPAPKVLFIYARGAGALMVAGEGTPMERVIELAGGTNAVSGFTDFKPLTSEALLAADPDAVLLFDSGLDAVQGIDGLLKVPGMSATKAGRTGAFIHMDGQLLSGFGPRVGQAITELNRALHALPK